MNVVPLAIKRIKCFFSPAHFIAVTISLLFVSSDSIAGTCDFALDNPNGNTKWIATMPLAGGVITVGRDVALGDEVYRQTFYPSAGTFISCNNITTDANEHNFFSSTPLPLANWSSGPYAGKVYESGLPGLGVVVSRGAVVPYDWRWGNCTNRPVTCVALLGPENMSMTLSLIKIGPVSAGVINGSKLPTVARQLISDNTLDTLQLDFSGTLSVVTRTCVTPDVTVPLGSHKTSEFNAIGAVTRFVEFSIALNNCPAFNGFYQTMGPVWTGKATEGTVDMLDTRKDNVLRFRIDPTVNPVDASRGILSLNPTPQGGVPAAEGVGVQLRTNSGPAPLGVLLKSGIVPSSLEGASYQIGLAARYIQVAEKVSAGPANATATFTIDYY